MVYSMPFFVHRIVSIVLFVVIALQLFYALFFFLRLVFYRNKKRIDGIENQPVSIILPLSFYDEQRLLKFISILKANKNFANYFELVLVLNPDPNFQNTDFKPLQTIHEKIKIIPLYQESKQIRGQKYAIAIGIKSATHDTILLTTEDCLPDSNGCLQELLNKKNKQTDIVLGYFNYKKEHTLFNQFIRFENVRYFLHAFSYVLAKNPILGSGKNMLLSRTAFYDNKGFSFFNNLSGGEDNLLVNQMGKKNNVSICTHPSSFFTTIASVNFRQWIYEKKNYLSTIQYLKPFHQFILALSSVSFVLFFVSLIAALFLQTIDSVLLIFILLRFVASYTIMAFALKKFKQSDLTKWIPIMEFILLFYYLFYGFYYFKNAKRIHAR